MSLPEDALDRARAAAERGRAEGTYPPEGPGALDSTIVPDPPGDSELADWAVIEVDPSVLYSTKRLGAPVTAVKRLMMRLMRQHQVEIEAQQTRFNLAVLARLRALEERVARQERE